jgi:hypothetical protein
MTNNLEERLWSVAQRNPSFIDLESIPNGKGLVREAITEGVNQMKSENVADHEDKIKEAEQNLDQLIRRMVETTPKIRFLLKPDFQSLKNELYNLGICPLWPFCLSRSIRLENSG